MTELGHAEERVHIPVKWAGWEGLPIVYASNVYVRAEGSVFLVSFGQLHGPYEINPDRAELAKTGVTTDVVGRFAFPAERWKEIVELAVANYSKWAAAVGAAPLEIVQTDPDVGLTPNSD